MTLTFNTMTCCPKPSNQTLCNRRAAFLLFCLALLLMLSSSALATSIGISPGRVNFNGVLRDGYAERTVTISTSSQPLLFGHLRTEGEIATWLSFSPNTTQMNFSYDTPYRLTIKITPPADVPTGNYTGSIEFVTDGVADVPGRAGGVVKAAVTLLVNVEVTGDQRIDCSAGGFSFSDVEEGFPLEFGATITNEGNVRLSPLITISLFDQFQENLLDTLTLRSEEVFPTTQHRTNQRIPKQLDLGQYWAQVDVAECDAEGLLTFSVVERGSIIDSGTFHSLSHPPLITLGETAEILANFENTGSRAVSAHFSGTIRKDDVLIKTVKTDEVIVPSKQEVALPILFTPYEDGRYVVSGRIVYNKKLSFEKSSILNVLPRDSDEERTWLPLLIYLAIILTIFFLLRKIVKEKRRRAGL